MRSSGTRRPAAGALVALAAGAVLAGAVSGPLVAAPGVASATSASSSGDCTVSGATLTWGFKESFRSYISGAIAKGVWEPSGGATYETPTFGWSAGSGPLTEGLGDVAFTGAVRFTGHQGVLDTTIADPVLRVTGPTSADLLLDVTGTTQDGEAVASSDVRFATIDLTASPVATPTGDTSVTVTDAPATLTDEGAAAFGTYPAGTALDPLTAVLPVACAAAPAPSGPDASETPAPETDDAGSAGVESDGSGSPTAGAAGDATGASSGSDHGGPWSGASTAVIGGAALLIAAAVGTAVVVRRRRPTAPSDPEEVP